jgi:hypothetical protein
MKNVLVMALIAISATAHAQPGGAMTYKCVTGGKVTYTDEPCVGAQVVDTTPTQGLDKLSGKSRKGADVNRIEFNEGMSKALKPLMGQTPKEYEKTLKRVYLSPQEKFECSMLDGQILDERLQEVALYKARKRFKDLKC